MVLEMGHTEHLTVGSFLLYPFSQHHCGEGEFLSWIRRADSSGRGQQENCNLPQLMLQVSKKFQKPIKVPLRLLTETHLEGVLA